MGVIPSGSKTDPYQLAMNYLKQQQQGIRDSQGVADAVRMEEAKAVTEPERMRRRYAAIGDANIDTAKKAMDAGLEMSGGRVASPNAVGRRRYGSTAVSGTKAANEFMRGLRDSGVTNPYALAAAMGHGQIESGFDVNASGDGGTASNIFQWREERQQNLYKFARQMGADPRDPYVAGMYAGAEMRGEIGNEKSAGSRILNAKSLAEANEGMIAYLRPKGAEGGMRTALHGMERAAASDAWYKKITSAKVEEGQGSMPSLNGMGEPLEDENGRKYYRIWPNNSHLGTLAGNWPETQKLLQPDLAAGTKKGAIAYRYYDPKLNEAPADPKALTRVSGPKVANPFTQEDNTDKTDDEDFDPETGE